MACDDGSKFGRREIADDYNRRIRTQEGMSERVKGSSVNSATRTLASR
jgi:hypothetical protein